MKLFVALFSGWLLLVGPLCLGQTFRVDTLQKTGPLNQRINVVILGDGYTAAELPKFNRDAGAFVSFFLDYVPFNVYRNYFNFFTIPIASQESGATNPGTAPDRYPDQPVETKNTYFGCSFGSNGIHRLVVPQKYQVFTNVMATNFPSYDLAIMIVNSPWYGGSGGGLVVFTTHQQANLIAVHETGHTLTSLKDEYWVGKDYAGEAQNQTRTSSPASVVWKNWLNQFSVGVYSHTGDTEAVKWFKPTTHSCLMEQLDKPYCAVCREATTNRILQVINPVTNVYPLPESRVTVAEVPQPFKLTLLKPNPNTLTVAWRLNDVLINQGADQVSISQSQLTAQHNTLSVSVFDTTSYIRLASHQQQHVHTYRWTLEKSAALPAFAVSAEKTAYCAGDPITLTASNCTGSVVWSTGATTTTLSVSATQPTTYSALCTAADGTHQTARIAIDILPVPTAEAANTGPYVEGQQLQLTALGGSRYAWLGPVNFSSSEQNPTISAIKYSQAGTYTVVVTSANGCMSTAQTTVSVRLLLSVPSSSPAVFQVFPNPVRGQLTVQTSLEGEWEFTLVDALGHVVLKQIFRRSVDVSTETLPSAVYTYRLGNGQRLMSGRLLLK